MQISTKFQCQHVLYWLEETLFSSQFCVKWSSECKVFAGYHGSLIWIFSVFAIKESESETPELLSLLKLIWKRRFYPLLTALFFTYCPCQYYNQEKVRFYFILLFRWNSNTAFHASRVWMDFNACLILSMYQGGLLNGACNLIFFTCTSSLVK